MLLISLIIVSQRAIQFCVELFVLRTKFPPYGSYLQQNIIYQFFLLLMFTPLITTCLVLRSYIPMVWILCLKFFPSHQCYVSQTKASRKKHHVFVSQQVVLVLINFISTPIRTRSIKKVSSQIGNGNLTYKYAYQNYMARFSTLYLEKLAMFSDQQI